MKTLKLISKHKDIILLFLLLTFALALTFQEVVFGNEVFVKRDISRYYYPLRHFIASSFRSGDIPLWNPWLFCGQPLLATVQSCVFYPLSLMYYLGDYTRMFSLFILFHFVLAGLFMYMLMKDLGLSKPASAFSSVTFAFSGYMASLINLTITLTSVTWFPLVLLFYRRSVLSKSVKNAIFTGIFLAVMFLGGDPSISYMTIFVLGITALFLFFERLLDEKKADFRVLGLFIISVAVFALVNAFQLLPLFEFLRFTDRASMGFVESSAWSIPIPDLIGMVIPFFSDIAMYYTNYWHRQSWLDNYYIGLIPVFFMLVGIIFKRSRHVRLLVILGLCSAALALGKYTALFGALYKFMPGFKLMRYPVRFFYLPTFAVSALSGIGLDYCMKKIRPPKGAFPVFLRMTFYLSFILSLFFLALSVKFNIIYNWTWNVLRPILATEANKNYYDLANFIYMDVNNILRASAIFSFFGLLLFLGHKGKVRAGILVCAVIVVASADTLCTNFKFAVTMDRDMFTEPSSNVEFIMRDKGLFRVFPSPAVSRLHAYLPEKDYINGIYNSKDRLVTNRMIEFGLYEISGYDSMILTRNANILKAISSSEPSDNSLLDMLNVKYVCSPKTDRKNIGDMELVHKTGIAGIYRNKNCLPRAYLADKATVIPEERDIPARMKGKGFDPVKEVI